MLRLFIQGREIELDDNVQFALNKQFEDITNPTTIINTWSKTVSIPFTAKNHETFGHIYNPDKIVSATDDGFGIDFNPLKKLDFRLEYGSAVLMTGYAKMNEVKRENGYGTYEITLFGELGKVLSEMSKITFDESSEDTDYIIDGSQYVEEYINKELVEQSWTSEGQTESDLKKKSDNDYLVTDIIGFAPNNSFSDGFKHDTIQQTTTLSDTIATYLDSIGFSGNTGIEASTVIGDGLLPRDIGEFRSYLQLPFIHFNKLFKIFQAKAEEVTGYQFVYDEDWFSEDNPYWYKLVYMLKPFQCKRGDARVNAYESTDLLQTGYTSPWTQTKLVSGLPGWDTIQETYPMWDASESQMVIQNRDRVHNELTINGAVVNRLNTAQYDNTKTTMSDVNALRIVFSFTNNETGANVSKNVVIHRNYGSDSTIRNAVNNSDGHTTFGAVQRIWNTETQKYDDWFYFTVVIDDFLLDKHILGNSWVMTAYCQWVSAINPVYSAYSVRLDSTFNITLKSSIETDTFLSNSYFTLNDMWDKSHNLLDEILRYCKMFRIGIFVDDFNKTVSFKRLTTYFSDYTVADWTDKVDYAKDFTVKPITFEDKYILFNYEDSDTDLGKKYKEKYGVNYGDYRLITEYNFNDETNELFEGVPTSMMKSENNLSIISLAHFNIEYIFAKEKYINNQGEDKKQVDTFGQYYFLEGLANFDLSDGTMPYTHISDDTDLQEKTSTYFYNFVAINRVPITTYPNLDVVHGSNIVLFNKPMENYAYGSDYSNKNSIYYSLWEKYINERYDINNKIITCYLRIKPTDYMNLEFNKFLHIGNQLYFVNKIYDYDADSNESTKVDLITIQDITDYTTDNYTFDYLNLSSTKLTIPYDGYKYITVKSSKQWELNTGDWTDAATVYPTSGNSGTTGVFIGSYSEDYQTATIPFWMYDGESTQPLMTKDLSMQVGGDLVIYPDNWYNTVARGSSTTVTISSRYSWRYATVDTHGKIGTGLSFTPLSGGGSNTTITVRATSQTPTGMYDIYFVTTTGDNATSFRVVVQ